MAEQYVRVIGPAGNVMFEQHLAESMSHSVYETEQGIELVIGTDEERADVEETRVQQVAEDAVVQMATGPSAAVVETDSSGRITSIDEDAIEAITGEPVPEGIDPVAATNANTAQVGEMGEPQPAEAPPETVPGSAMVEPEPVVEPAETTGEPVPDEV